jgi:starvation-inducible DNA-binding protein
MKSHETKNDLQPTAKAVSIDLLNARLAYAIDLALVAKQAHWNLKGIQFVGVREMLGTFRTELDSHIDTIAERVVQLGGTALGTCQTVANKTVLKPYPTDIYKITDHVAALIERYSAVANAARVGIDRAEKAGDADTADILTEFSRNLDKSLSFLEAHLQEAA